MANGVELKGFRDGLRLIVDLEGPIGEIENAIRQRMANLGDSLAGTKINIELKNRQLTDDEFDQLNRLMDREFGLELRSVDSDEERSTADLPKETPLRSSPTLHQPPEDTQVRGEVASIDDFSLVREETEYLRSTLRSGQSERFLEGNIVIVGDVNPGAEIIAAGDIIVFGTLRGIAHAGALGDTSAVIMALNLTPTQIRIASFITRPPTTKRRRHFAPEIARIKDRNIIVEEFRVYQR